jgi:hypothetical protein
MLSATDLRNLFTTVFKPRPTDRVLTIIVDVPDDKIPDNPNWRERREMAYDWWVQTITFKRDIGLHRVELYYYPNVGSNNNDLPEALYHWGGHPGELVAERLAVEGITVPLDEVFSDAVVVI